MPLSNILFFSNSSVRGGVEEHILLLLRGLDRKRFRPVLACTPTVARLLANDLPADVEVVTHEYTGLRNLAGAFRLRAILRQCKIDVLHSHLFWASLFASPVGWLARVPVILETPHIRESWRTGWKAKHWIDRIAGRFVDGYIAVSSANRKYLIETKGLPGRKISVVLNGADLKRLGAGVSTRSAARARLGLSPGELVLLVAARLAPQKGHSVLMDAMPAVLQKFPNVRAVFVGDGELRDDLEAKASRMGIAGAITFAGFQGNVAEWMTASDICVLPSFYEGLPLVAIEAQAVERPVVATHVDGTPEVVKHGETGLLVPAGDSGALASALIALLEDAGARERMGRAGRQWVARHFTQEGQIAATEQIYATALSRRKSGGIINWLAEGAKQVVS